MKIVDKVKQTIISHNLISAGDRVLVALSGGSDSVFMTDILIKLAEEMNFTLCAAHVNHNMREEALRDENFVRAYCEKNNIECYVKSVDVPAYALDKGISTELAGRDIRYSFFEEIRNKHSIDKLATAHNRDDSAESVLLHLIRGCGVDGLCGIPYKRDGYIIRPILDITKKEVEEYCKKTSLAYVQDKTNFETDYTRNKVRNIIIPKINDINENFVNTVTKNAVIFKETADFMNDYSNLVYKKCLNENGIDVEKLKNEHIAVMRMVIQLLFEQYTEKDEKLSFNYIDKIISLIKEDATSKTINLPKGISARIEYNKLYFTKTTTDKKGYKIFIDSKNEIYIDWAGINVLIKEETVKNKNTRNKIYFYKKRESRLYIRNKEQGDIFYPVGMTGRKRISDLFSDMKIPAQKRDEIPILCEDDNIIWVMGVRCDRRFSEGEILMSAEITEGR